VTVEMGRIPRATDRLGIPHVVTIPATVVTITALSTLSPCMVGSLDPDRQRSAAHDAAYVALAARRGLVLATIDQGLKRACNSAEVKLVE
jgi:hypothetical protein